MAGNDAFARTVDELVDANRIARALLSEIRSDMKDMRDLLKEVRVLKAEMEKTVQATIEADIAAEVKRQVELLGESTKQAMTASVEKVNAEFDKLTNLMLSGDERGCGTPLLDLAEKAGIIRAAPPAKGCRHPISFHGGGHTSCRAMGCNCPGWSEHDGQGE